MRIGVVTHYWLPHRGGVEVMAYEQSVRLARRGHDVRVVTSAVGAERGVTTEPIGAGSLRVERLPAWDALGRRGVPWPAPGPALVRAWCRLPVDTDVVVVHGCTYAHAPVVVEAARRAHTPVVVLQANPHVEYGPLLDTIERLVDRSIGRWTCKRSDRLVSISAHTARHVDTIAPGVATHDVVRLGVDPDRFRPATADERHSARRDLGIDRPMVLTVRRLVARNGVGWAIRSWIANGLGEHADLVVVGDGPQRAELERLGQGHRVHFLGNASDATVRAAFRAADVFVMPTRSGEGFGLAAAEAMSCGLPVVATSGGALDEIVADGHTGFVVDVDDPEALAAALGRLVADAELRTRMGAAGRERVLDDFTWDRSVERLDTLLADTRPRCVTPASADPRRRAASRRRP